MHQIDNLEMKAMSATPEESTTADIENGQMQHFDPHDGKSHEINTADVLPGSDIAYERKISILNEALIGLGMNSFQWKIFFMTGFGWFVDNASSPPSGLSLPPFLIKSVNMCRTPT